MDRELIERLAKEAGRGNMAKFAALIAEECAKVCDAEKVRAGVCVGRLAGAAMAAETAESLAAAIREKFSV